MKFRTELNIEQQTDLVSYKTDVLSVGSCFADEIGSRLSELRFPVSVNPSGIIFNPVSLADLFRNSLADLLDENLFVERDKLWYHYGFHSRIHASSKSELKEKAESIQEAVKKNLKLGNLLMITFGTAWVYRHLQTNRIVANCHKIPQKEFSKELLDLEDLKGIYSELFRTIFSLNPELKIMLTVSPVRHVKDGLRENNLAKSILLLLTDYLEKQFEQVSYFPAYELITDDLRDYRFYKEDLIHPSKQAVDYVFEKFSDAYFSERTKQGVEIQKAILQLRNHRVPSDKNDFELNRMNKIKELDTGFNNLNLT